METLKPLEIYEEIIDDCFLNIWFVESWEDELLFVVNREFSDNSDNKFTFVNSCTTEYCGQSKSCGDGIEKIEFTPADIIFHFNETGKKYLGMDSLKIIYPDNFELKLDIQIRLEEITN